MKESYTLADIAEIIHADVLLSNGEGLIFHLAYDSRKIIHPSQTLFFALKDSRDGHDFVKDAYRKGVRNFVVEKNRLVPGDFPEANVVVVDKPLGALQQLAAYHRAQFDYPVIGITGSNGKTVVKEWLNQLLAADFTIVRSPKSFNSQIGVALSLWEMNDAHNLAIIEAGISKPGEMDALAEMIRPTIGVLTNIRQAHRENFATKNVKMEEKVKLFREAEVVVYSPNYVPDGFSFSPKQLFTWDNKRGVDLEILENRPLNRYSQLIGARYKGERMQIEIPFQDEASIENAITCWSVMLVLGIRQKTIEERMKTLSPVKMRLELKNGINNCSVIDDSYSCDVSSLAIALEFLHQQNQHQKRTLVLSDIPEIGNQKESVYTRVTQLIESNSITRFIGIGPEISHFAEKFGVESLFFPSTDHFIAALSYLQFRDESILLKGARKFAFERISRLLSARIHETSLEINLNALESNLKAYKSLLKPKTKVMVMVKAFSYGSGSFEIANILQFNHVDYLAVAYADEGITLRKAGISIPVMVMNPDVPTFESLIDYQLEPEIFSLEHLKVFADLSRKKGIDKVLVHIKVETGMHRLGFETNQLASIAAVLKENSSLRVASVFSHLAAASNPMHDFFTEQQISTLKHFSDALEKELGYSFITHVANTAAISRFPEAQFDMVRLGIGLYGIKSVEEDLDIRPVATLKTSVAQIKNIKPGDTIGYNRKGKLESGGKIATVRIGYADGYNRRFGNGKGEMMINGVMAPTVGDICMDMCMLDVSGFDVKDGDEVVVFGAEPRIEKLASTIETIPYEVLTGISQRVKRIYFYE